MEIDMETDISIEFMISTISNELKILYGEDYGEKYYKIAINSNIDNTNYQILIEGAYKLIDNDYKDKIISNLKKKSREQDARIKYLEQDVKILKQENKELKEETRKINKKLDISMRNHYYIVLSEAIKKIEYYIIQTVTKFDNPTMNDINLNLDEFVKNKDYEQYKPEIEKLMEKFEMNKYKSAISKIINKRNDLSHPNPIELDELELACDDMKKIYPGIEAIYTHYNEVYEYFEKSF